MDTYFDPEVAETIVALSADGPLSFDSRYWLHALLDAHQRSQARIAELEAQLAAAKSLRLGRAPSLVDHVGPHEGAGGLWLVLKPNHVWEVVRMEIGRWPEGQASVDGWCVDAIPLDADRNPCPIGGWGDDSEGGEG